MCNVTIDMRALVDAMTGTAKRYSIDSKHIAVLPLQIIVLGLKYVDRKLMRDDLFPGEHVHWELVESCKGNLWGDSAQWTALMATCKWDELSRSEQTISRDHHSLSELLVNMKETALDTGGGECWTFACQLYLLQFVRGIQNLHSVELMACRQFQRDTATQCVGLMAKQAGNLVSPEECQRTTYFLLKGCSVDRKPLEDNLALLQASRDDRALCLKMKFMTATPAPRSAAVNSTDG